MLSEKFKLFKIITKNTNGQMKSKYPNLYYVNPFHADNSPPSFLGSSNGVHKFISDQVFNMVFNVRCLHSQGYSSP